MRQSILLRALSALAVVAAADFTIDPSTVELTTRNQWCAAESSSCDLLCGGNSSTNDCDPDTLEYECVCTDGNAPDLAKYTQTMPTFICEKAFQICNEANVGDAKGQANCTETIQDNCGTEDPTKADVSSGDSQSSAAASSTAPVASNAATDAPTSTSSSAAMATNAVLVGNGIAAVAVGVFAAALL